MEVFRLVALLAMFVAYTLSGDDGNGFDPHGGRTLVRTLRR